MDVEQWAKIPDWPSYEVSNLGKVRNLLTSRVLKPALRSGYLYLVLCHHGKKHPSAAIHRLVAETFCFKPLFPVTCEVNHKNGNKQDNRAQNLEWVTRSANQRHAADIGLKPHGEQSHLCTKLNARKVARIRTLYAQGHSQGRIAERLRISQTHVGKIVRKEKWRNL